MTIEHEIRKKLSAKFNPTALEVENQSHLHNGHASSPGTGESHFAVAIVSAAFVGKSRVERHRMVNAALVEELEQGIHALAIKVFAPGEVK